MANATKIIKDWCASCGMPEPSDGECHALTVALAAAPAADAVESVLIDGTAYEVPAPVACELLYLHMQLLETATQAADAPVVLPEPDEPTPGIASELADMLERSITGLGHYRDSENWSEADEEHIAECNALLDRFNCADDDVRALLAGVSAPAAVAVWDGKLPESLQRALNELRIDCKTNAVSALEFEVRSVFKGMHTSLTTVKRMYHAAQKRLDSIDAAQPDPFAAPQAPADARDAAFEAARKKFCKLQRYSFFLDDKGNVRRVPQFSGNWVEFESVHTLFDPTSVDAAIAAAKGE